jgi:phenylacetate-CoA ligase
MTPNARKWDAQMGCALAFRSAEEIRRRQDQMLRRHVFFCASYSPYYRNMFERTGVALQDIASVDDLVNLPFTEKRDLEELHEEFLALERQEIVDLCLTSGTTGKPVSMLQAAGDLERLTYNEELSFRAAGVTADDKVLIAAAIDRCFMAGLAYFLGLTKIGATVIRGGSSSPALLMELIRNCRPTAIVGVPSLLLTVGERLQQDGTDPSALGVKRLVLIGEPIRKQDLSLSPLGERLAECWGSQLFGTYASTEMATSFTDCAEGLGGHLHPELIAVEIVDENGQPVPPGDYGEVVATPLGVTGMPLLRFRTGDIAALHTGPCACGRNTPRLGPLVGRKSQMLKYRGTTVYPPAIWNVLQEMPGIRGHYIEARSEFALSDQIRVVVGSSDPSLTGEVVAEKIAAAIRVRPEVAIVTPEEIVKKTLQEDKRKPVIFFDYR